MSKTRSGISPVFVDRLRSRRLELHLTAKEVYTRAGITRSYYHRLETRAGINPSADVLERIAAALDTTHGYLLGRTEVPNRGSVQPQIPSPLSRVGARLQLSADEVRLLNSITWRGRRPQTEVDWLFLAEAISRAVR